MSETPELTDGALRLRAFLEARGLGPTAAAKALGCTHPAVIDWLSGPKRPAADARKAIAIWTGGEVPEDSWIKPSEHERLAVVRPFVDPSHASDAAHDSAAPQSDTSAQEDTGTHEVVPSAEKVA